MLIQVDTSAVTELVVNMVEKIKGFPHKMADELTHWQAEDMHRTVGLNTALKENVAETIITQHTQSGEAHLVRTSRRRIRRVSTRQLQRRGSASEKPILRQSLLDMLDARMQLLLQSSLKWR